VVEGDFLRQGRAKSAFSSEIDPKGQIMINGTSTASRGGSGTIATITFKVLSAMGSPVIQVISAVPTDAAGSPVSVTANASVTVPITDPADN